MGDKKKVCLIGSGNWGSAIAKIVGVNVTKFPYFDPEVRMYVYEEQVNGRNLTEIINTEHENVKYLPGHKLPPNIVAIPDVAKAAENADVLIIVIPHQFLERTCAPLKGKLKSNAMGISLSKGFGVTPAGGIILISELVKTILSIDVSVLMGANLANEVADGNFCETTIGCRNAQFGQILKDLFQTPNFRVTVVTDRYTVEICGALKNIVACAAGFGDGLKYGDNTKAAIIRIGLKEMVRFCKTFYADGHSPATFFESCGIADLITTCYGGRNRRLSEQFVIQGKSFADLEKEMLNGQKLQGPQTAHEVHTMLSTNGYTDRFPLFVAVHLIATQQLPASQLIEYLRKEPDDM